MDLGCCSLENGIFLGLVVTFLFEQHAINSSTQTVLCLLTLIKL